MLRRQEEFRLAAEYVASAFSKVPEVGRVVLFGSAALPLKKEVPRFQPFRRAGTKILHECKDVDIAVWLEDLGCLRQLQRVKSQALNELLRESKIGVAHHQVDVFLMEPATGRYLGRLCTFASCPKGKPECLAAGCGKIPLLRQHEEFVFSGESLAPEQSVLLYQAENMPAHPVSSAEPTA